MTQDTGRRDALFKAKLRALVRTRWAPVLERARDGSLPGGAALVAGDRAWALAEEGPERSLGPSIAWARKAGAASLDLIASTPDAAGALARRATRFAFPVTVWRVEGVGIADVVPAPLAPEPPVDPKAEAFRGLFERAGTEAVVEQGILRAEVLGLEVARIVDDDRGLHLEVGVGRHDRAMNLETRRQVQGMDELFEVVRTVAEHRCPNGEGHDAFHLAPERWLRAILVRRPDVVRAASLEPAPAPMPRPDLRRSVPAPARGETVDGEPLLVVCSVGLDLDLVSAAADAWLADGREPKLTLCLPVADAYPAVRDLASLHVPAANIVTVPAGWRSL